MAKTFRYGYDGKATRADESEGIARIIENGRFMYYSFSGDRIFDDMYNETGGFSIDCFSFTGFLEPEYNF